MVLHEPKSELPKMSGKWWEFYLRKYEMLIPHVFQTDLDAIFIKKYADSDSEEEPMPKLRDRIKYESPDPPKNLKEVS